MGHGKGGKKYAKPNNPNKKSGGTKDVLAGIFVSAKRQTKKTHHDGQGHDHKRSR